MSVSTAIAVRIGAQPRRCYLNALRALTLPELAGGAYCEGHCLSGGVCVPQHGWVELAGRIVDPTLPDANGPAHRDSARAPRTLSVLGIAIALPLPFIAALLYFFGAPVVVHLIVAGVCGWKARDVERVLGGVPSFGRRRPGT